MLILFGANIPKKCHKSQQKDYLFPIITNGNIQELPSLAHLMMPLYFFSSRAEASARAVSRSRHVAQRPQGGTVPL